MKESITKFDLEAAFKALDELEAPAAQKGIKANKPALTEIFSNKSKFDALFEEYYDIGSTEELSDAKEAREAEVAKAKLARIEKIVDLDAESPEDLLTSYVGKLIVQCPQCMTLFYKNAEDVEESEDDPNTVNVNEVCQHCGNESGYTLVGKVGAVEEPVAEEETELAPSEEELPEEPEEETSEDTAEASEEDFDLDSELEELDLDIEEEETEANESLDTTTVGVSLTENLTEDSELETSAEDFEKLINSPEFKKPVSDADARAMMQEFSDDEKEDVKEALTESVIVNDEVLEFAVINPDGTFAGVPCTSEEEARELAAQKEGRLIVKLTEADVKALNEGNLIDLGKALGKKIGNAGKNIKKALSKAIDNLTAEAKTREEKADWIREYAMEDYDKIKLDTSGKLVPDEKSKRFRTFVIIGFTEKFSNGKLITIAPSFNNKDLVQGKNGLQVCKEYKKADDIAKGWSMRQGNGPAFIYLAKDDKGANAVFLCEYFNGELEYDQLEKYYEIVKKDIEASELMKKAGMRQTEEEEPEDENFEIVKGANLKPGMVISMTLASKHAGKIDGEFKIAKVEESDNLEDASVFVTLGSDNKDVDGALISILKDEDCKIVKQVANESLEALMNNLEELQEASLESKISDSLVEAYGNVAGFRLHECSYQDGKLNVSGKIHFTSGNTRQTTYVFAEAFTNQDKITLCGLNEKLGKDKQFNLTGLANTENKTFITESFVCIKK